MKRLVIVALLACTAATTSAAADRVWQHGVWRDMQLVAAGAGAISLPMGGTPPSTVAGVTIPGTAPTYLSVPIPYEMQYVTIDGPNNLRYVARWRHRLSNVIINDPTDFTVEGEHLFVRGQKPGQVHKFDLVSTTRLE